MGKVHHGDAFDPSDLLPPWMCLYVDEVFAHTHTHRRTHIHTHAHAHTNTRTYTHTNTHKNTRTHAHTHTAHNKHSVCFNVRRGAEQTGGSAVCPAPR